MEAMKKMRHRIGSQHTYGALALRNKKTSIKENGKYISSETEHTDESNVMQDLINFSNTESGTAKW